jgi:hypothetical protein
LTMSVYIEAIIWWIGSYTICDFYNFKSLERWCLQLAMLHCLWTPYLLQEFEDILTNYWLDRTSALNKVSIHNLLGPTPCQNFLGYPIIPITLTQTQTVSRPTSAETLPRTRIWTGKHSSRV